MNFLYFILFWFTLAVVIRLGRFARAEYPRTETVTAKAAAAAFGIEIALMIWALHAVWQARGGGS